MLKFFRRRRTQRSLEPYSPTDGSVADTNPELHVRNLMDDPAIRRALGLDGETAAPQRRLQAVA